MSTVDEKTKQKVAKLIQRLCHPAWCDGSPENIIRGAGRQADVFNIYWQLAGRPARVVGFEFDKNKWEMIRSLNQQAWKGYPVGSYVALLGPREFYLEVVQPWQLLHLRQIASKEEWERKFYANREGHS